MSDLEAILRWWLILSLIAAAAVPFAWWLFEDLEPLQQACLRPLGIITITFFVWWPCAAVGIPFTSLTIWVVLAVIAVIGWVSWARLDGRFQLPWRSIVTFELLWSAMFLGYLWFRSANAAILNTEKPMEIALLSSIARSADVPAPDPWLAGESINYYYFGYQAVATIAKLAGVPSNLAFNLALATIFASLVTIAAGTGYLLSKRLGLSWRWGVLTASLASLFVVAAGNLETAIQLVRNPSTTIDAGWWNGIGWSASRVIADESGPGAQETINEFPAFSLILGDLHPHLLTAPHLLLVIALAIAILLKPQLVSRPRLIAAGALIGLLYASNSWDAPVGLAIVAGAYMLTQRPVDIRRWTTDLAILAGSAIAAVAPFIIHFDPPVGSGNGTIDLPVVGNVLDTIAVVTWRPSSVGELLTVHGLWIALFIAFAWQAIRDDDRPLRWLKRVRVELAIPLALFIVAIAIGWAPAVIVLGLPCAAACLLALDAERREVRAIAALFATGFALALLPEFIYIQDIFGNRMNTVFKLYFQAWFFLAIASAATIGYLISKAATRRWLVALPIVTIVLLIALPYSALSIPDWRDAGAGVSTIDGTAFIERANPSASEAIDWLDDHAENGDLIVEVPGCAYRNAFGVPWNRMSAYTGVPTLLGWANHERQWRRGHANLDELMLQRNQAAQQWLTGEPPLSEAALVPRFIIFGQQEIEGDPDCQSAPGFGSDGIAKLEQLGWITALEAPGIRILVHETDAIVSGED